MIPPQFLGGKTIFAHPRLALHLERWHDRGQPLERPVIRHPGAVAMIAQPDPSHLLLVRQWRYSLRAFTLEIPAGTLAAGEDPASAARRELREETGWTAAEAVEVLRVHPAPGASDELMQVYRMQGLSPGAPAPDAGEVIECLCLDLHEVRSWPGRITDAKTLLALALLGLPISGSAAG